MEMLLYTKENLEIISKLEKAYPNDFDLGREIRKIYRDNSYIKSIYNDQELGKQIRKVIKSYQKF